MVKPNLSYLFFTYFVTARCCAFDAGMVISPFRGALALNAPSPSIPVLYPVCILTSIHIFNNILTLILCILSIDILTLICYYNHVRREQDGGSRKPRTKSRPYPHHRGQDEPYDLMKTAHPPKTRSIHHKKELLAINETNVFLQYVYATQRSPPNFLRWALVVNLLSYCSDSQSAFVPSLLPPPNPCSRQESCLPFPRSS